MSDEWLVERNQKPSMTKINNFLKCKMRYFHAEVVAEVEDKIGYRSSVRRATHMLSVQDMF